ncbi:DNA replication complex GINS protein SLD5-like [Sycon ciliatum]|uniref:DNA replication complex GINS protein SLD5-like n=1 Tax=Sycon ciliatum TaxID=27933 RepID=UPI0020A8E84E|eukprot:scpid79206/ scgid6993/ DNA replication complex GINS protein SLD5; GINS complex subunit 4
MASFSGGEDDDLLKEHEEVVTGGELLVLLEETWHNEKVSPDLLPTRIDLVESMLEQLQLQDDVIQKCAQGDIKITLLQLEVERIRFLIASYLRARVHKIEQHPLYLLDRQAKLGENDDPLLSPEEVTYAKQFADNMAELMQSLVLRHMPLEAAKQLDTEKAAIAPNTNSYVFLKAAEDVMGVVIDEEEDPVDLLKGTQHLLPYRAVEALVKSGSVVLL